MKCPQCGAEATGAYCSQCGAEIPVRSCPACQQATQPGANYCIFCGTRLRKRSPGAKQSRRNGVWVGAAAATVLVIAGYWTLGREQEPLPSSPPIMPSGNSVLGGGDASRVDLSSMTPREAADRLYDRIMRAASAGDTAEALGFLPMAIGAYDLVDPLDEDGHYHVSLLHALGSDYELALETAEAALTDTPEHLLLLGAAAQAAAELGDDGSANDFYRRLLAAWDGEQEIGREEYAHHTIPLEEMRQTAEARVGG